MYVAYYRRSLEYFLKVKEQLSSGKLGKILTVHIHQHFPIRPEDLVKESLPWRVIPEISGGGYFHDMGCHALDIMFFLLGDPVHVSGAASNLRGLYEPEDTITALITFNQGIQMTGNWSFVVADENENDRVTITTSKGSLSFSIFSFDPIQLTIGNENLSFAPPRPEHIQMPFIQSIVGELTGNDSCPSTGITAAVTSRVMEEILKQMKE